MTRRAYYRLCAVESADWLKSCADNPSPAMKPRHVALIRLALRNGDHA